MQLIQLLTKWIYIYMFEEEKKTHNDEDHLFWFVIYVEIYSI